MLDNDPSFILKFSSNFNLILIDVESSVSCIIVILS